MLATASQEDESGVRSLYGGYVYTWGLGDSGCLGHGNYETVEEPKQMRILGEHEKELEAVYVEAGGYHNGVIASDGQVYMWGRGDVGQLGVKKELLTEDQQGLVALQPTAIDFEERLPI